MKTIAKTKLSVRSGSAGEWVGRVAISMAAFPRYSIQKTFVSRGGAR
jgi:hypothetical protein